MRRILLLLATALLCIPAFAQSGVFISEYIEGSSNNKAIEIFNGTGAPLNISNYQIRMYYNGNPNAGLTITLAGTVAPGDVYVLAHSSAAAAIQSQADQFSGAGFFNGDDAVALYHTPTASLVDVIGQIGFDPGSQWGSGNESTADNTLRRKMSVSTGDPNGSDAFNPSIEWDGFANNTFDDLGQHGAVVPPPPAVVREIFEIQGSGSASPYAGQTVETLDNIVTAVGHQGFFIQTPDYRADASTATSNGIYVFTGSTPTVQAGDQVDVKGTVTEFFNFTEYTNTDLVVTVDASGQPVPATFDLPAGYSDFEPLEGMLVRASNGSAADGTDQFGETMIVAASSRPFRTPGLGGDSYPEILDVDPTGLGGAAPSIVGGATIALAEGPLAFDFGDYSIWTTALQYTNPAYPSPVRARNAGELTVGAQNMFRLFDSINDPLTSGNDSISPAVYATRVAKISDHVRNVMGSPDVLAVSEVENMTALAGLAAQINLDQAGLNYVPYLLEGNDVGGIDVGFLVRDTIYVDSIAQLGADDMWMDPSTNTMELLNDRPPLLLTGSYVGNGAPFPLAVIAVHQRSLIGIETTRVQQKRQAQAENLAGYINALPSGTRLVVTGDFNAFEFDDGYVDAMGILTSNADLTNQVLLAPADDRYSYIQNGVAQVLDHSVTSSAMNAWVRDLNFAHANADKPFETNPASDHDGVVLFVMSDNDGDGYADDTDDCPTGDASATVVLDGCDSGAPNIAFEGGCTLADQIAALHASAANHGQFTSAVAKLLNDLVKSGQLTGAQKGAIQSCAAQWN